MRRIFALILLTGLITACTNKPDLSGTYRGVLHSDGGPMAFNFVIEGVPSDYTGYVINSSDTLEFTRIEQDEDSLLLAFDFYDADLRAAIIETDSLSGSWIRKAPGGTQNKLPFTAKKGIDYRFESTGANHNRFDGEWSASFVNPDGDSIPATGIFFSDENGRITGTFARETGDYRFLEGVYTDSSFTLTSYTGARSYLFKADLQPDSSLSGEFWARDNEYFTWTATKGSAQLRDPFNTRAARAAGNKMEFGFPTPSRDTLHASDPAFNGKPMLVYLYGTWCPNCSDLSAMLKEYMNTEFAGSDLQIIGLAFEYTGNFEEDAQMVEQYRDRFGIPWPLLVAGTNDKTDAAEVLPFASIVLSFPTTYFVNRDRTIESVHVGFNGPATGPYYYRERERFKGEINTIIR